MAKASLKKSLVPAASIVLRKTENLGARYISGRMTFDEQFKNGRLCTRYWSTSGQIFPEIYVGKIDWPLDQPSDAFILGVDGQMLSGGLEWQDARIEADPSDYRGEGRNVVHSAITLYHKEKNIQVKVHTRLDGSAFMIRWLEIKNLSEKAVGLTAVSPFAGSLWSHRYDEHLPQGCETPFELAYNHSFTWGYEGDFWFEPLTSGVKTVNGEKMGRSGWGRPAFWAKDLCNGQTFVCEQAWGGNYEFALDSRLDTTKKQGKLFFRMGLSGYDAVLRVLSAGETLITPSVHFGFFQEDMDAIVQATHDHVRHVVMPKPVPGRHVEIEANHRGYLCDRENEPDIKKDIEVAASVGTELYVIDAGWYGNEPNVWHRNVGDWFTGTWLPNGLEPIVAHAKKNGMRFGLWVEIEAAGDNSTLRKEHSDWLYKRNGEPVAGGRALDLTNPKVAKWAESQIERLIKQYKLDMYRIDHNHNLSPSGNRQFEGYTEDLTWRYYESLYGIFNRLRKKFPRVVFQNCAGGGGRLDWGTLHLFNNTELSDWMRNPRGLKILNGVTMSLPPEILLRTFGTEMWEHDLDADVDFQLRVACLSRPILRGIAPSLAEVSPFLRERIEHHLNLYKKFLRPVMIDGRIFHHTGCLAINQQTSWCVLEYAAKDSKKAAVAIFKTSCDDQTDYHFRPRGLDASVNYRVTLDNTGQSFELTGKELTTTGLTIHLEAPLTSEMFLFSAV